jgi:dGTPase
MAVQRFSRIIQEDQSSEVIDPIKEREKTRISASEDIDKIFYSDELRRLTGITQVVTPDKPNIFHSRQSHTFEVARNARRIAEHLLENTTSVDEDNWLINNLEPNVVEAAGLIHDLGHPPFGHVAEHTLNECIQNTIDEKVKKTLGSSYLDSADNNKYEGFEGNAQSFRVVTKLASPRIFAYDPTKKEHGSFNLSKATLNAILKYPKLFSPGIKKFGAYHSEEKEFAFARDDCEVNLLSPEAWVMNYSDDITNALHDMADFLQAGLIPIDRISQNDNDLNWFYSDWINDPDTDKPTESFFTKDGIKKQLAEWSKSVSIGSSPYYQKTTFLHTESAIRREFIDAAEFNKSKYPKYPFLGVNEIIQFKIKLLKRLVWRFVVHHPGMEATEAGQKKIIKSLYEYYISALQAGKFDLIPAKLHYLFITEDFTAIQNSTLERLTTDIICGLTDQEAYELGCRVNGIHLSGITAIKIW